MKALYGKQSRRSDCPQSMKRYCKEVNILDMDFLRRCARDCLRKKWKRNDVTRFFVRLTGWDKDKVTNCIKGGNREILVEYAAQTMQRQLAAKKLEFPAIWYKEKVDSSSQKLRLIGIQNIAQQIYDYVAVYAMEDLMRRIGEYQCASIPGRGPLYGVHHVQKWLKEKGTIYAVQMDVQKCFPSIPQERVLAMIDKYVANDEVRWLVRELVHTFGAGLSIGSFLSQYLCNLYLSQLYHEITERMYYTRRGKRIRLVKHVLFYMDDLLLIGSNAKSLNKAAKLTVKYAKDQLGLTIKPGWCVRKIEGKAFIDTMGFRVYRDHVTIRKRVFLRVRRAYKAPLGHEKPTLRQAQKCTSYSGIIKHSSSQKLAKKYKIYKTIRLSRGVVSNESKFCGRAAKHQNP